MTVTETVESEPLLQTPESCIRALDGAREVFDIMNELLTAIGELDIAAMEAASAKMDAWADEHRAATERASKNCRDSFTP